MAKRLNPNPIGRDLRAEIMRKTMQVNIDVRCTEIERNRWRRAAQREGMSLSLWVRRTLTRAAAQTKHWEAEALERLRRELGD